jgi:hypothetical protein
MKNKLNKMNQDPELENPVSPLIGEVKNYRDNKISVTENYTQNEFDDDFNEYDTFRNIKDLSYDYLICVDDLSVELNSELENQINQIKVNPDSTKEDYYYKFHLLHFWKLILEEIRGFLSSRQLFALNHCIGTYASCCATPSERRKEIRRNIYILKDWFEENLMNMEELEGKIYQIDPLIFFELTEILINSNVIQYCGMGPEINLHNDFIKPNS